MKEVARKMFMKLLSNGNGYYIVCNDDIPVCSSYRKDDQDAIEWFNQLSTERYRF